MCATPTTPSDSSTLPDWYDPFPEPRTIPTGWDLSEYLNEAPASSATPAAD